ncbi:cobalamin biosynthesis protein CobW [Pandoraea terrae]|uniref:Cobalamin biosynthesis protein CobW n=1 Tax=Pandoraea terrae TaxID=1537710 RepID=A0A5E4W171_9BURK|nr:GTP-binding protein [Pandoraea terrae]VVE16895.1 cobalamin biosynthesis protein CobW [Pandoraea terrae]
MNTPLPVAPIALTILSGFLGAGKTTLLNRILRAPHGLRIAVLINDFGDINIDAALVARRDEEVIDLANGCICCSIGSELMAALLKIAERPARPDYLIIEASGVSDPWKIAQIGLADPAFRLDGVIVLADAEAVRSLASDRYVGDIVRRQLTAADIVVLNKTDLISVSQRAEVSAWLRTLAPDARQFAAVQADVPMAVLLGAGTEPIARAARQEGAAGHGHAHHHDRQFDSWSFTADRPFCRAALERVLDGLPTDLLRGKGLLLLQDDLEHPALLQIVGRRRTLMRSPAWRDSPRTALVLIGVSGSLDPAALDAAFTAALA